MGQVVLDSSNLDAIVKDATGEGIVVPELPLESGVQTQIEANNADKSTRTRATVGEEQVRKAMDALQSEQFAEGEGVDPQDIVDPESGLTPRQQRELSAGMKTTISKRHARMKEAEEFAADQYNNRRLAEAKTAELQAEIERLKTPKPKVVEAEPKREDFKTDAEFTKAQIDYGVKEALKERDRENAKRAADEAQAKLLADASARIAKAIELVPDFVEVTEAADMTVPPAVAGYMQKSPLFAEIGYYLAKNPEVLTRLQNLAPDEQLVEIGEIKSTLKPFAKSSDDAKVDVKSNGSSDPSTNGAKPSTETESPPSPRASAPVIRPLSSGGASQVEKSASERSYAEERAYWQKKNHVNLTRRSRH